MADLLYSLHCSNSKGTSEVLDCILNLTEEYLYDNPTASRLEVSHYVLELVGSKYSIFKKVMDLFGSAVDDLVNLIEDCSNFLECNGIEALNVIIKCCNRCSLRSECSQVVPGCGVYGSSVMFIGEAPGANEDSQGLPFVGKAGVLLDKMMLSIGLSREDVYITNIVKCRPVGNKDPDGDSISYCSPFLDMEIDLVSPSVICTLGKLPGQRILGLDGTSSISSFRGVFRRYRDIPVMPTYHPAFLLRKPEFKKFVWEDLKKVKELIDS
ncbi:MAG: uracil-DNA glycosylase [bacterium]|nr:uracil-DNA glycosylase [bacterium]